MLKTFHVDYKYFLTIAVSYPAHRNNTYRHTYIFYELNIASKFLGISFACVTLSNCFAKI